jgi:hypothetical protein
MKKINVLKVSSTAAASAGLAACGMISFMDASLLNSAMAGNGPAPTPVPFSVTPLTPPSLPSGNDAPVITPTPASTSSTALQNAIQNNSLPPQNPVTQSPVSVPDFRIQLQQGIGR